MPYFRKDFVEPVIVLIRMGRVKVSEHSAEVKITSSYDATQLLFNGDSTEFLEFRDSYGNSSGGDLSSSKMRIITISNIFQNREVGEFWVPAQIIGIESDVMIGFTSFAKDQDVIRRISSQFYSILVFGLSRSVADNTNNNGISASTTSSHHHPFPFPSLSYLSLSPSSTFGLHPSPPPVAARQSSGGKRAPAWTAATSSPDPCRRVSWDSQPATALITRQQQSSPVVGISVELPATSGESSNLLFPRQCSSSVRQWRDWKKLPVDAPVSPPRSNGNAMGGGGMSATSSSKAE
nr:replication factor A protein 1-like [Ipomoea batatas]